MREGEPRSPSGLGAQPAFPKRFYTAVGTRPEEAGFALVLDGRPARTPGRAPLVVPTKALAQALAAEWDAIETTIDPRAMPLTRLVNSAIDGVSRSGGAVLAEAARFAGSDLLAYRATEPADLVRAQRTAWDPVIDWSRAVLGAPLTVTDGVMPVAQPAQSLERIAERFAALSGDGASSPFRIAALHVMTTLTGSALLAAAVAMERLSAEDAWSAAHVDEDHEIAQWGEDAEAAERRAARWIEMQAAARLFSLA